MKDKVLTTDQADVKFSKMIRERDGRCLRCGSTRVLTCSHFYSRAISSTRYNFDNCITLCWGCHKFWEPRKNREYRDFMVHWLGKKKFKALEKIAYKSMQRIDAIREFMNYGK